MGRFSSDVCAWRARVACARARVRARVRERVRLSRDAHHEVKAFLLTPGNEARLPIFDLQYGVRILTRDVEWLLHELESSHKNGVLRDMLPALYLAEIRLVGCPEVQQRFAGHVPHDRP